MHYAFLTIKTYQIIIMEISSILYVSIPSSNLTLSSTCSILSCNMDATSLRTTISKMEVVKVSKPMMDHVLGYRTIKIRLEEQTSYVNRHIDDGFCNMDNKLYGTCFGIVLKTQMKIERSKTKGWLGACKNNYPIF